ncbi:MAG: hypothetical protein VYD19_08805 [Myxococcota bacterium]|nr:hypothetical protein [Myxococcota bacterium]
MLIFLSFSPLSGCLLEPTVCGRGYQPKAEYGCVPQSQDSGVQEAGTPLRLLDL